METARKNRAVNRSEGSEIQDRGGVNTEGPWAAQRFKDMNENTQGLGGHHLETAEGEEEKAVAVEIFQEWWKWVKRTKIY